MSAHTPAPKLGVVAGAIWYKTVVLLRRYLFNTISLMVSLYVLFLIMFFGAKGISGAVGGNPVALGNTLDATVVGFFLWFLVFGSYADLAQNIMQEARLGTLEQLMMTPVGFRWVSVFQVVASTLVSFLMSSVILIAMMLTTGRQLHIDVVTVLPLLVLAAATAIGIGFAFAGLALIYKRIEALFMVMQFFFVALISAPAFIKPVPLLALLPISLSSLLLNEAMTDGLRLIDMGADRLLLALLSSAAYFAAGLLIFARMERKARDSGNLAQY